MIDEDDFWSNWWNENLAGETEVLVKTYPSATLSTTKSHMTDPVSIPGPQRWEASD
jgi:predicted RNA-binding protein with PUA-like domain